MMRPVKSVPAVHLIEILVTLIGLLAVTPTPAVANAAVVSTETATVFEEATTISAVVGLLSKGDRVTVRFSLGRSPVWCRIEASGATLTGYTPCAHVQLQTTTRAWHPGPERPEMHERSPRSIEPPSAVAIQIMMNKYNAAFWARWLGFSENQMQLVRTLAQRTGVSECRARIVAWHQRHNLDDRSQPDSVGRFKRAMRDLPSVARGGGRCDVAQFWREFPRIMTPDQRQEFETWQRQHDIPILTRHALDPSLEWLD